MNTMATVRLVMLSHVLAGMLWATGPTPAWAKNCGNGVAPCACGDTVIADYTLPEDLTLTATGHGLIVGGNDITIDGNGHTITGDLGYSDYGIYNNGYDRVTIENFVISNFSCGIYFNNHADLGEVKNNTVSLNSCGILLVFSDSNRISDNTVRTGFHSGINLTRSNNNILVNNTVSSDPASTNTAGSNAGIYLGYSNNNSLIKNTVNSNPFYGIRLYSSNNNSLAENQMSGNVYNLQLEKDYQNIIDISNLVEGKPVYYLLDRHGTPESRLIYDGTTGEIGMFWAINCGYIELRNAVLSPHNYYGILFDNTVDSCIRDSTVSDAYCGLYLLSSNNNEVTGNTTSRNFSEGISLSCSSNNRLTRNIACFNPDGIILSSSNNNVVTQNQAGSNALGIGLVSSTGNIFSSNALSKNLYLFCDTSANSWMSNLCLHNALDRAIVPAETARTGGVGRTVGFDFTLSDLKGNPCSGCDCVIMTSPPESVMTTRTGNRVTGSFVVTRPGMYSLMVETIDANGNVIRKKYAYWAGEPVSSNTRYYLREVVPTHGQPVNPEPHGDAKSLLPTPPDREEWWSCGAWIQNSPDKLPEYPFSNLTDVRIHSWYCGDPARIGIERFASYDLTVNYWQKLTGVADYTENDTDFMGLNWAMDYQTNWYWLALKLLWSHPRWRSTPSQPSYADFTYEHTDTPAILSNSNEDIVLLSATSGPGVSSIVLENSTLSPAATRVVLTDFQSPFLQAASTISPDAVTTLATGNLSPLTATTFESVLLRVLPSDPDEIIISTWATIPPHFRRWTERTGHPASLVSHTLGDLDPGRKYLVWQVDGTEKLFAGAYSADGSGEINFLGQGDATYSVCLGEACTLAAFAQGFGSIPGESNEKPFIDLNGDSDVDGSDLANFPAVLTAAGP